MAGERTHSHSPKKVYMEWKDIKRIGELIRGPKEAN